MLAICGICIISYILFAPADTIKRPLPNKRKRTIRKWATVLTGIIYTLIIAFFNSFLTPLLLIIVFWHTEEFKILRLRFINKIRIG